MKGEGVEIHLLRNGGNDGGGIEGTVFSIVKDEKATNWSYRDIHENPDGFLRAICSISKMSFTEPGV